MDLNVSAGSTAEASPIRADALAANIVLFGRLLRRVGLAVDLGQTYDFVRVLNLVGVGHKGVVKAAARTIFVRRREEQATFDAAFELFWRRPSRLSALAPQLPRIRQTEPRGLGVTPADEPTTMGEVGIAIAPAVVQASAREVLRRADFAELTSAEVRDAQAMIAALRPRLPLRRTRRGVIDRAGTRPAARAMLRRALATGGQPLVWRWLRRASRPRPMVLILDISGSMERYSRFLLRFAHGLMRSGAPVEVFVFGTRLTRITRQLRVRDPDAALRQVAEKVVDWSGGTRIGESLRELNLRWVRRTVPSGAVVFLASDGWERGDPELLAREMGRLRRSCHRLLWLDPLASRPGFEPATAGLRAALPHVDDFVACASVASLEDLAARLGTEIRC